MRALNAYLVTGIPGAGKTTVSRLLAMRFPRAAHIEVDRLQEMLLSGGLWPDMEPYDEAMRQLALRARNAALLARSFFDSGFVPVVDDVIVTRNRFAIYRRALGDRPLQLIVLAPRIEVALARDAERPYKQVGDRWIHLDLEQRQQLGGIGTWIDSSELTPEQTVDAILARCG